MQRHISDLIQKKGSLIRHLEFADLSLTLSPGKGTAFVTK